MKKKVLIFLSFISSFLIFFPLKGVAMSSKPKNIEKIKEKYQKINFSDGISKVDAGIIAQKYVIENARYEDLNLNKFKIFNSGFNDNWWVVSFDTTLKSRLESHLKWFDVHIDKKTGEIKSQGWGPA